MGGGRLATGGGDGLRDTGRAALQPWLALSLSWLACSGALQHEETAAHHNDIAAFADVVRACKSGTIVVMVSAMGGKGGKQATGRAPGRR